MYIRGGATGSNPHQGISTAETTLKQILASAIRGILKTLRAAQQRRCSSSQYTLDEFWRAAKRGWALRCV